MLQSDLLEFRHMLASQAALAAREHIEFVRQRMADTAREAERRHTALRRLGGAASDLPVGQRPK